MTKLWPTAESDSLPCLLVFLQTNLTHCGSGLNKFQHNTNELKHEGGIILLFSRGPNCFKNTEMASDNKIYKTFLKTSININEYLLYLMNIENEDNDEKQTKTDR